jgi:60 kDa SS-A/Ro ribonucleoprotein
MSMSYTQHVSGLRTPQAEPARSDQVKNDAGGYAFQVDIWTQLDRFLILGTEGGTYYVDEKSLTVRNYESLKACLAADGLRTVARIKEISLAGRAPKNDSAIFALAVASGHTDRATRTAALAAVTDVCRIGTHLFQFIKAAKEFRGWGRGLRLAVARWYDVRSEERLSYQLLKYQQRDGMSHRDVVRLSHPTKHQAIYRWLATQGHDTGPRTVERKGKVTSYQETGAIPEMLLQYEVIKRCTDPKNAIALIEKHGFTHEMVPSELKGRPEVWEALLQGMPLTATIRNLGKMTSVGLIKPLSQASKLVAEKLQDGDALRKQRVHPIAILAALKVYGNGKGVKGSLTWSPDRAVMDALDAAYYLAFGGLIPTGKRTMLALDVSGSMGTSTVCGMDFLSAREAAAAMAMVTARVEKEWHAIGFTGGGGQDGFKSSRCSRTMWGRDVPAGVSPLKISSRQRLDDIVRYVSELPMGGTDCALPIIYALEKRIEVDVFHVYTDNETWAGNLHPFQALREYRNKMGIPAKMVVAGFSANHVSIADPNDAGMMDVAGFDSAVPSIIADFVSS